MPGCLMNGTILKIQEERCLGRLVSRDKIRKSDFHICVLYFVATTIENSKSLYKTRKLFSFVFCILLTTRNDLIDRKPKMKNTTFLFSVSFRLRKLRKRAYFLSLVVDKTQNTKLVEFRVLYFVLCCVVICYTIAVIELSLAGKGKILLGMG